MKHILTTVAISFVTAVLTMIGVIWCLYSYPIPISTKNLSDGTIHRTKLWLFRGVYETDVTTKRGMRLKSMDFYPNTPEQTLVTYYFYGVRASRVEVATVPYSGVNQAKIYKPESNTLLASSTITLPTNGSESEKQYFDALGATISKEAYVAILTGH